MKSRAGVVTKATRSARSHVRAKARPLAALLALAAIGYGCAVGAARDGVSPEPTGTVASEIRGGKPVNSPNDPVSTLFPLSTVRFDTQLYEPDGGPMVWEDGGLHRYSCTGVILSPTQILTAAHCMPSANTVIYLYGTNGDLPTGTVVAASTVVAAAKPPGVVCDTHIAGSFPATCFSNGHYSDLAVIEVSFIFLPNHAAALGPVGQYQSTYRNAAWEVGTGLIDDALNPSAQMTWVPVRLAQDDANGSFDSEYQYADYGDSGGPVFQLAPIAGVDAGSAGDGGIAGQHLLLIGILSSQTVDPDAGSAFNTYTSVEDPYNNAWIQSQIDPFTGQGPTYRLRSEIDLDLDLLDQRPHPIDHEKVPFTGL